MIKMISLIINYAPLAAIGVFFLWALFAFWRKKNFWLPIWLLAGFDILMAVLKSIVQYWVWDQSGLTHAINNLPLKKLDLTWFGNLPIFTAYQHGYFLFYAWNNFWRSTFLTILAAFIIYFIFLALRKYKKSLLDDREAEAGLLFALIIGWPQVIFFLPVIFIIAVLFSLFNLARKCGATCNLFWPLAVSTALIFIFSGQLDQIRYLLFKF
jgi:hypothetical protein